MRSFAWRRTSMPRWSWSRLTLCPITRSNCCCRLGNCEATSANRSNGTSHTLAVVSATASQRCSPAPSASRPISSPGRWKPTTCSSPSSLMLTVLKAPSRATYTALKASPGRNRRSPRSTGRRRRTISSRRCRSCAPMPAGRHSCCSEHCAQPRRRRATSRTIDSPMAHILPWKGFWIPCWSWPCGALPTALFRFLARASFDFGPRPTLRTKGDGRASPETRVVKPNPPMRLPFTVRPERKRAALKSKDEGLGYPISRERRDDSCRRAQFLKTSGTPADRR